MKLSPTQIEEIEINCLLEAINQRLGYDFRHYARTSLQRRLRFMIEQERLCSVAELIPKIMHDEAFSKRFLSNLSVNVTEMFRDPSFFKTLIQDVFPTLKTFPFFKIWHAGCATGEEAYSLAILLEEAGIYDRARVYATDINLQVIQKGKEGLFSATAIAHYEQNYRQSGGQHQLADYFYRKYGTAKIADRLKRYITFANHNLVSDGVFAEVQLIVCRNVLIYFDIELKQHVINLFHRSLCPGGILCLGSKESLDYLPNTEGFEVLSSSERIYKKRITAPAKNVHRAISERIHQ